MYTTFCVDWLNELITKHEFSTEIPTLLLWEGVTNYISQEVVESTLEKCSSNFTTAPCLIAFDYSSPKLIEEMGPKMKALGESWVFGMESNDMVNLLTEKKLQVLEHISLNDGKHRYFPKRKTDGKFVTVGSDTPFLLVAGNSNCHYSK